MVRAVWNGKVIAESDRTEVVEGNHYFSPEHVRREYLAPSDHHATCAWKGAASYYHIVVDGAQNRDRDRTEPIPQDFKVRFLDEDRTVNRRPVPGR